MSDETNAYDWSLRPEQYQPSGVARFDLIYGSMALRFAVTDETGQEIWMSSEELLSFVERSANPPCPHTEEGWPHTLPRPEQVATPDTDCDPPRLEQVASPDTVCDPPPP